MANLLKVLPRVFCPRGNPLQLVFFVTAKCNLRCEHCFYAPNLNNPAKELTLEEIEKTSKSMGQLLWFSLTGGEPFLREDLPEIARIFYRNNKFNFLTICTNGLLHEQMLKAVDDICRSCKKSRVIIYVSLDGLEETHNRIRGVADGFDKAVGAVKQLKGLKKTLKNLNVATATTCNAWNQKELKALALFLKNELKPDSIALNILRGFPRGGALGEIDLKHYFDFIEIQKQGWRSGDLGYFNFLGKALLQRKELLQKKIISAVFRENKYMLPCLAGKISCVLSEKGDLFACEILDEKIGNIREAGYDFNKLWRSRRADELRRSIKDSKCFCTYECAITTNILFNPKQLAAMCGIGTRLDTHLAQT